jgi:hypothetical protein
MICLLEVGYVGRIRNGSSDIATGRIHKVCTLHSVMSTSKGDPQELIYHQVCPLDNLQIIWQFEDQL